MMATMGMMYLNKGRDVNDGHDGQDRQDGQDGQAYSR